MSLKQFPAHGTFSKVKDDYDKATKPNNPEPEPRTVASVFDVNDAWDMLDKRQQFGQARMEFKLGNTKKLDAARVAAAAGIKVTATFSVAAAVAKYRREKFREMLIYCLFLIFLTVSALHNRMVPERGMLLTSIRDAYMAHRFTATDGTALQFHAIHSEDDFWDYMTQALPQALFSGAEGITYDSMRIPPNTTCGATPGCVISTLPPVVAPANSTAGKATRNGTNTTSRRLLSSEVGDNSGKLPELLTSARPGRVGAQMEHNLWPSEEPAIMPMGALRRQEIVKSKDQIAAEKAAAKQGAAVLKEQAERQARMNMSTSLNAALLAEFFGPPPDGQGMVAVLRNNYFVQPIRIRQVRVSALAPIACNPAAEMLFYDASPTCWPELDAKTEQINGTIPGYPLGNLLEYRAGNVSGFQPFSSAVKMEYGGGGFSIDLPVNLTMGAIRAVLTSLKEQHWTDKGTRAVFVDMVTYNPPLNIFVSCRLSFEFTISGRVRASSQMRAFPLNVKMEDFNFAILYYLEILSYLIIFGFLAWDLYKIYKVTLAVHFDSWWNCINFLNYVIFMLAIQRQRGIGSLPVSVSYAEPHDNITTSQLPVEVYDFEFAGAEYSYYSCMHGFCIMVSWLRITTYIKFFSGHLSNMVGIVGECIESCLIWFAMIFIVVITYAQTFYLAFGPDVQGFDSFATSLTTICSWVFSQVDYSEIVRSDEIIAGFLFASFEITFTAILLNMFLVILMRSYGDGKDRSQEDVIATEIRKMMTRELVRIRELIKDALSQIIDDIKHRFEGDDEVMLEDEATGTTAIKQEDHGEDWEEGAVWPLAKWNEGLKKLVKGIASLSREITFLTERVDDLVKSKRRLEMGDDVDKMATANAEIADDPNAMAGLIGPRQAPAGGPGRPRTTMPHRPPRLRTAASVTFVDEASVRGLKEMRGPGSTNLLTVATPNFARGRGVSFSVAGKAFGAGAERESSDDGAGVSQCKSLACKFARAAAGMERMMLREEEELRQRAGRAREESRGEVVWLGGLATKRIAKPHEVLRRRKMDVKVDEMLPGAMAMRGQLGRGVGMEGGGHEVRGAAVGEDGSGPWFE